MVFVSEDVALKIPQGPYRGGNEMNKSMRYSIGGLVVALGLLLSPAMAGEQMIPVPDAGFDNHVLKNVGDWIYIGNPAYTGSWKSDVVDGAYVDYGYWRAQGSPEDLLARSGNNKVYPSNATTFDYVYQILDETFIEGATYTLSVWVGNAWPEQGYADGWGLYFTGEDYKVNLIEAHGLALSSNWEQISVAYTATAADAGKKIGIKMSGEEGESYICFDDVTLSYKNPIPASDPSPADEQTDVPRDVVLSWTPGQYAAAHDVYFGTTFDDVNEATTASAVYKGRQDGTTFAPGRLQFGTTYYWRIDEVNAAPDSTTFKGETWSFTTELEAYPVAGTSIKATASSSEPNQGPENTINSSGMTGDVHSAEMTHMWLTAAGAAGPAWIQYEFDKVLRLHEMRVWNHNGLMEQVVGLGAKEVKIEYSIDGNDFKVLGTTHEFARAPGTAGYVSSTTIDLGGIAAKYIKLTINSNWGNVLKQYGLSEVRFYSVPVFARGPSPTSGEANVDVTSGLSWRAGREAARHNLYLSKDQQAVTNGTAAVQTVISPSYTPALDLASTYYWRVDEVNDAETPSLWQRDLWTFSTQEFAVVDDFESYTNDSPKRVFQTWIDGAGFSPDEFFPQGNKGNGSGALIGYDPTLGPIMETKTVHGGKKAMPFYYGDQGKTTSEATRTFSEPQDWSKHGIRSLCLYFSGRADNQDARLYVRINNGDKLFYPGEVSDLKQPIWMAFIIDLAAVSVNLSSVKTLTIGVEGAAAGTLVIDDIGLYPVAGELITPKAPDAAGLLAHYKLDGDGKDTTGKHHGTLVNSPTFVAGKFGQALNVTLDQHVNVPYAADLSLNTFSMGVWVNISDIAGNRGIIGTRFNGDNTFDLKVDAARIHGDIGSGTAWLSTAVDVPVALSTGEWYHICYVFDDPADTVEMYLNGILARKMTVTGTPLMMKAGQELRIGVDYPGETFRGSIDDVRIYNHPLSAAEVAGLAGRTIPFDKSL